MTNSVRSSPARGISLVVPVRDEAPNLPALIESIGRQTRAPEEILIVDGGSRDGSVEVASHSLRTLPNARVVQAGAATPGRGRNVGIGQARNDWVALTDAGIRLEPTWLEQLVAAAEANPAAQVVWGSYEPVAATAFARFACSAYVPARQDTPAGRARGPSIASCLIHRPAWQQVGGFPDLRAAEDLIFMERLERAGIRSAWAPEALAWWSVPDTARATFRRFRLYSKVNALAGRQAYWHHGVARIYAVAAVAALGAVVLDRRLALLLPAGAGARAAKALIAHREERGVNWALNPVRMTGVIAVLGVVDAGTFTGWFEAILERRRNSRRPQASLPQPTRTATD